LLEDCRKRRLAPDVCTNVADDADDWIFGNWKELQVVVVAASTTRRSLISTTTAVVLPGGNMVKSDVAALKELAGLSSGTAEAYRIPHVL
jgi:hypothetical protein